MAELYLVSGFAFGWLAWVAFGVYRRPTMTPPTFVVWALDEIAHHWREHADGKSGVDVDLSGFNGALAIVAGMRAVQTARCVAVLAPQNDPFKAACVGVFVHRLQIGWLSGPDAEALRRRLVSMGIADASSTCTAEIKLRELRPGKHRYTMRLIVEPFA